MLVHDWVLNGHVWDMLDVPNIREKSTTSVKLCPHLVKSFIRWGLVQPPHATVTEAGAGGMHYAH
jgi:hypothetical protein